MQTAFLKSNLIASLVVLTLVAVGCSKDQGGSSATPNQPPVASTPDPSTDPFQLGDSSEPPPVHEGLCSQQKNLSLECMKRLTKAKVSLPMWTQTGYSKSAKGPWLLKQMYSVRPDKTLRYMRGINRDLSKAGPLLVWNDQATFQNWGDQGNSYVATDIKKTSDGALRFEFNRYTLFTYDFFTLECFSPVQMQGRKLLCVWYRYNSHTGREDFKGYIEFDKAKKRF